ncbi:hypothetical protein [Bacillus thuringiensis]|uniref:hypothetical protein n=1 Tax=Bacillus thuringiensis TaxID=1428 RepID=UPI000CF8431E|nr:hypothetical protein [Bacillus thuringiensis]PQQ45490.1 hypothetical protein C6A34_19350 [Bacillus thuringiensis]
MEDAKEQSIWKTKEIYEWADYIRETSKLKTGWIFRGQKSVGYDLSTSYYRALQESSANLDPISLKIA